MLMAVAYHLSSLRFQTWLARRGGRAVAYFSVAGFLGRLTLVGVVLFALTRWDMINIIVTSITFVIAFSVLGGVFIYRSMSGGNSSGPTTQLLH